MLGSNFNWSHLYLVQPLGANSLELRPDGHCMALFYSHFDRALTYDGQRNRVTAYTVLAKHCTVRITANSAISHLWCRYIEPVSAAVVVHPCHLSTPARSVLLQNNVAGLSSEHRHRPAVYLSHLLGWISSRYWPPVWSWVRLKNWHWRRTDHDDESEENWGSCAWSPSCWPHCQLDGNHTLVSPSTHPKPATHSHKSSYTLSKSKQPLCSCLQLCWMPNDFKILSDRLSCKFLANQ